MGDLDMDDAGCRVMSKGAGVKLVSVDYRLAPQHPYPAGPDDCVTAYKWTLDNAVSLGGSEGKVFIGGVSAGGGLTFGVALHLVDDGLASSIAGLVTQVPATVYPDLIPADLKSKYTSYEEHSEHTVNSKSAMYAFYDAYGNPKEVYANPLLSDSRLMKETLESNG
jgi:versiconal hemiacetal acetate esterase